MSLPIRSRVMKSPIADELIKDPLKWSFMNPGGVCHLTRCVEVLGIKEDP